MNYTLREKLEFQQDSAGPARKETQRRAGQTAGNKFPEYFLLCPFPPSDNKSSSYLFTHSCV